MTLSTASAREPRPQPTAAPRTCRVCPPCVSAVPPLSFLLKSSNRAGRVIISNISSQTQLQRAHLCRTHIERARGRAGARRASAVGAPPRAPRAHRPPRRAGHRGTSGSRHRGGRGPSYKKHTPWGTASRLRIPLRLSYHTQTQHLYTSLHLHRYTSTPQLHAGVPMHLALGRT